MGTSLVVKELILDKIPVNQYFYTRIFKEYKNPELAKYLTKYLTFWLQQKNPDGDYFLDYFQDYSIGSMTSS